MALNTGFDRETTRMLLAALGWEAGTVDAIVCDTALDLRAGHNAGVRFNVGVLTGAHGRDMLQAESYTHLLESVVDLPAVLAGA